MVHGVGGRSSPGEPGARGRDGGQRHAHGRNQEVTPARKCAGRSPGEMWESAESWEREGPACPSGRGGSRGRSRRGRPRAAVQAGPPLLAFSRVSSANCMGLGKDWRLSGCSQDSGGDHAFPFWEGESRVVARRGCGNRGVGGDRRACVGLQAPGKSLEEAGEIRRRVCRGRAPGWTGRV